MRGFLNYKFGNFALAGRTNRLFVKKTSPIGSDPKHRAENFGKWTFRIYYTRNNTTWKQNGSTPMTENLLMDAFFVQFGELKNGHSETHVDRRHKISTLSPMETGVAGERQWFNKRPFTNHLSWNIPKHHETTPEFPSRNHASLS